MNLDRSSEYVHDFGLFNKKKKHPYYIIGCFCDQIYAIFLVLFPDPGLSLSWRSYSSTWTRPDSYAERSVAYPIMLCFKIVCTYLQFRRLPFSPLIRIADANIRFNAFSDFPSSFNIGRYCFNKFAVSASSCCVLGKRFLLHSVATKYSNSCSSTPCFCIGENTEWRYVI